MTVAIVNKKLIYCILVTGPIYGTQNAITAWKFANTLLIEGHILNSVFFYQDGVYNANSLVLPSNDELNLLMKWKILKKKTRCQLNVCIGSALRRGIMNDIEAKNHGLFLAISDLEFVFSGLGSLSEAIFNCDRVIQF